MTVSSVSGNNTSLYNGATGNSKTAATGTSLGADKTAGKSMADQLQDYVNMSPGEKLLASLLGKLGLTPEDMANMSPAERAKIEDKITSMIKEKVQDGTVKKQGSLINVAA